MVSREISHARWHPAEPGGAELLNHLSATTPRLENIASQFYDMALYSAIYSLWLQIARSPVE